MAQIKVGCMCLIRGLTVLTEDNGMVVEVISGPKQLLSTNTKGWEVRSREPAHCYLWSSGSSPENCLSKEFWIPEVNLVPISDPGLDVSDVVDSKTPIFNQER